MGHRRADCPLECRSPRGLDATGVESARLHLNVRTIVAAIIGVAVPTNGRGSSRLCLTSP
jgi:hypothetical protein